MHDLLNNPISKKNPCGTNLQYDSRYIILFAKTQPQEEVQYGHFIEKPEPLNWSEIKSECETLLKETKDINLYILLMRANIHLHGSQGCLKVLSSLYHMLVTYPDDIHPQLIIDGFKDEAIRANSFIAFLDTNGFLQDLRKLKITQRMGTVLSLEDIEQAYSIPKHNGEIAESSIHKQVQSLLAQNNETLLSSIEIFQYLEKIITWCNTNLCDYSPDFSILTKICSIFVNLNTEHFLQDKTFFDCDNIMMPRTEEQDNTASARLSNKDKVLPATGESEILMNNPFESRQIMHDNIKTIRQWFEQHEPSSPVIILLKQTEQIIGKSFVEVLKFISADTLQNLENSLNHDNNNL